MPALSTSDRVPAWQWMRAGLLSANMAWTTLCLGGVLPGTRMVSALLTAALVVVHFSDPERGVRGHVAGWLFVPFLAYAAWNAAWVSPVPWLGWIDWLNWAQAIAVYWIVLNGVTAPGCRRLLCLELVVLGAIAAVLAAYQHFLRPDWLMLGKTQVAQFIGRSTGPFGIPNTLGVFMALLIPPVGAIAFQRGRPNAARVLGACAAALLVAGFILAVSRGAWLALGAAFALKPLISPGRSLGRRFAGAAVAVGLATAVAALLYVSFPLMRLRVDQLVRDAGEHTRPILWRGAWSIFEAHPVAGGGAGGFDVLFESHRPEGYRDQPVYAHCDYLNTLADYGAVGFSLFFGAAAVVAWRCSGARGLAGAAYTGLLAFALHLLVDFHLKIPALAMIAAIVAGLVTSEAWPATLKTSGSTTARRLHRAAALCTATAVIAFTCLWVVPKYRAEELRRVSRGMIDRMAAAGVDVSHERRSLEQVLGGLSRAVALDPANAQAWSDTAYAESLWALVEPERTVDMGVKAERDAAHAVSLCPIVAEFWVRRGMGCDMQGHWAEGGNSMVHALQLAPIRADVWYYQAYHLSLVSTESGPAIAAADYCLRLDPGFLLAQALRQRLGARP